MSIASIFSLKKKLTNIEFIKVKILVSLLFIGYLRCLYIINIFFETKIPIHLIASILGFIIISLLLRYIFKHPKKLYVIFHTGIILTFFGMLYRILFVEQFLITQIQTIFLIIMWSYYGLGKKWELLYSIFFVFLLPIQIASNGYNFILFPEEKGFNYYFTWALFLFNTFIIIYVPFLYQNAIKSLIRKKVALNDNLRKSIENNKEFTSVITHELRTPLNSVIGISNLLKEKINNQEDKNELNNLLLASYDLMELINDMLEFNKMNLNILKIETSEFDIKSDVNNFLASKKIKIDKKDLKINLTIDSTLSYNLILTDAYRISTAIHHLFEYMIKVSPEGTEIDICIEIKNSKEKSDRATLLMHIQNKSIILKNKHIKHIFEPFSKSNKELEDNGLNLAIVKKAFENLRYNIDVFNSTKTGLKFQFYLPIKLKEKESLKNVTTDQSEHIDISTLKILVVDDNPINLIFMKSLLNHWGIVASCVSNGHDAIQAVKNEKIDIILMDLHMPIISGFETSAQIRIQDQVINQPYIIAVSAINKEDLDHDISNYGINDFISKSVLNDKLKDKLFSIRKQLTL